MPGARRFVTLGRLLLAAGALAASILPTAASAQTREAEPSDLIVLSGDVVVRRGEDVGEVVVFHGTATVAGVAHGDVVVLDGRIDVTGQVSGSVVAVHGPISIGPNAQILGDVIGRERLQVAGGARIGGEIRRGTAFTFRTPIDVFGPFAAWLAVAFSTLVLGALLVLLAPRALEATARSALGSPWGSAGIGLGVAVGLPVVAVLAVVSLVGLPFGLGLLLALTLVYSIGFVSTVFSLGRAIWRVPRSRWLAFALGWVAVSALSAIPFVGAFLWIAGATHGLGALTLSTWRARGSGGRHRPGGKMPATGMSEEPATGPAAQAQPMITERAMGEEGTGI